MKSESLSADESSSEDRGPNQATGGRSNSEKSILIDDQDCKSIDSHMSSLRMPKYLQNLEHMAQFKDVNETEYPSYEGTERTNKISQSQKTIQRQLSVFNMSVCYARCGYIVAALQCINLPKLQELSLFIQLNTIVYLMIQLPLPYHKNYKKN